MEISERRKTTVAIVGYGPVGGALANLLARQGVDVAIIEPYKDVYPFPRAGGIVPESLRLFQTLEVIDQLDSHMVEWTFWYDIFDKDWNRIIERKPDLGERYQDWAHNVMFFQPALERALREENDRLGVKAYLGFKAEEIVQDEDGVDLRIAQRDGTPAGWLRADWVIGCDGSRSIVREAIGGGQDDLEGDQAWLLVYLRLIREDVELPERIFEWANPDRQVRYVTPFPHNLKIFEFKVLPGETQETLVDPDNVWELLSPWLKKGDAEFVRTGVYEFHSRVANRWRDRRLLIAGDAAHEMPPTLGEGLNSGFRDAMNLGWKLAGVIDGTFADRILDSYEQERKPHVRTLVEISNTINVAGAAIAADPEAFRASVSLEDNYEPPRPRLDPGLHGNEEAPVGTIADQPRLADGTLFDDAVGYRIAVVATEGLLRAAGVDEDAAWSAIGAIPFPADEHRAVRAWLERLGTQAVIVRPDRYILGVADNAEELRRLGTSLAGSLTNAQIPTGGSQALA
ncbi:bifunctional 3-(3-hydroxy-phenyl)propionate/3-hydroxycinnamic acid hydroxylase [Nocardia sp. NPDC005745]|uniref:bifunctional 3-(3-hydroxy-phenyl)propionate/3-hydroxycinnamic acid hydroxylase n=1 Tax=Nocardia sp. NPDC005745 TaxID=3157061 RepID=UPI0033D96A7C